MTMLENRPLFGCSENNAEPPCSALTDLFYGDSPADAKQVCFSCDMQIECLEAACEKREMYGVWGGVNFSNRRERYAVLRRYKKDGNDVVVG